MPVPYGLTWLVFSLILPSSICSPPPLPTVSSVAGTFIGNSSISDLDQFLGIPYAKPPTGTLRFANPEPLDGPLSLPFYATEYGPGCLQDPAFALYNGLDENCLSLNIIRPSGTTTDAKLPVLFWIHGGGNVNGQSIYYNGTAIVQFSTSTEKPVIYVGINYRLGGFGFLSSPDLQAAGLLNNGLRDQHLALQWVNQNVESFGGDPTKVTIFGESAGAWDCQAQLHYAYAKNETDKYFRGLITQSGSAGSLAGPKAELPEDGLSAYQELLNQTNCTTASNSIACLREVDASVLAPLLTEDIPPFAIDDDWFSKNLTTLLTDDYEFARIPIIHGANLDEGSVFLPNVFPDTAIPDWEELVAYVSTFINSPSADQFAGDIVDTYVRNTSLRGLGQNFNADPTVPSTYWPAVAVYSDIWMHLGRRAFLRAASENDVPAWGFYFQQTPPLSQMNLSYEYPGLNASYARRVGVQHGSELAYVFGEASNLEGHTDGDVSVSTTMMRAWISFAYDLNPNSEGIPYWPRYSENETEKVISGENWQGQVLYLADQGDERSKAGPDDLRADAYEAWNDVMESIGIGRIY